MHLDTIINVKIWKSSILLIYMGHAVVIVVSKSNKRLFIHFSTPSKGILNKLTIYKGIYKREDTKTTMFWHMTLYYRSQVF